MRTVFATIAFSLAISLNAQPAHAASVIAFVDVTGGASPTCQATGTDAAADREVNATETCKSTFTNSSGNNSSASGFARASTGSVGIAGTGISNYSFDPNGMSNRGSISAIYNDSFSVGNPLVALVEVFWELEGQATIAATGGAGGTASVGAQINGNSLGSVNSTSLTVAEIDDASPFYSGETGSAFISVAGEVTPISIGLGMSWSCGGLGGSPENATCGFAGSFANSLVLTGARGFDSNGTVIDTTIFSNETGFDFVSGFERASPTPVPLPAGLPLLLSALFLTGILRRS